MSLKDDFLLGLGSLNYDILGYGREEGFEEPAKEDPIVQLDLAQDTMMTPFMDMIHDMGSCGLVTG